MPRKKQGDEGRRRGGKGEALGWGRDERQVGGKGRKRMVRRWCGEEETEVRR